MSNLASLKFELTQINCNKVFVLQPVSPLKLFQADLDIPDLLDSALDSPDTDLEVLSSGALSRQYSRDATTSTVSIQGSGNHYHACASDEYEDVGFDPSILPPPDPWIDSVTDDQLDVNFNSATLLEVRVAVPSRTFIIRTDTKRKLLTVRLQVCRS